MSDPGCPDLEADLAALRSARRVAIVGIGDELQRADRLGLLAARETEALRLPGVRVFLAGTMPESFTGPIRRFRADHVVLLDAAHMGARPGCVAVVSAGRVRGARLSTHALPLTVLMEYLETDARIPVTLVGLQPDLSARGPDLTPAEESGILRLVAVLQRLLGGRPATTRPAGARRASG